MSVRGGFDVSVFTNFTNFFVSRHADQPSDKESGRGIGEHRVDEHYLAVQIHQWAVNIVFSRVVPFYASLHHDSFPDQFSKTRSLFSFVFKGRPGVLYVQRGKWPNKI